MTNFSVNNISKPSHKKWKAVADFFLYSLPLYLGAIMTLPVDDTVKMWLNFGASIVIISLKGLSKLTTEDTNNS